MECCAAAFRRRHEEKLYRAYLTDALNAIAVNTMQHAVPGVGMVEHGTKMTGRWIEIADRPAQDPEPQEEDTRTAREITDGIWARMRGGDRR